MSDPAPRTTQAPDRETLRQALRRLAGGVTVVASYGAGDVPCGIVMTAVMSLSFDPPSMLIAINKNASLLPAVLESGLFTINMVSAADEGWCRTFVSADATSRFAAADWERHPLGTPVYRGAIAHLVCEVDEAEPFGSHVVIRGLVRDASFGQGTDGLIYLDGRYARPQFCS